MPRVWRVVAQQREQSEFNSAVSYLNRLNLLLAQADEAAMSLNAYGWNHSLLALYRELSTELNDEELKEYEETRRRIKPLLDLHLAQQAKGREGVSAELYDALHYFEIKLRRIMRESGLQQKIQEDIMRKL